MPRGPFKPIPLTAKVEVVGHNGNTSKPIVNVLHALVGSSPTLAQLNAIGTAVMQGYSASHADIGAEWTIDECIVTDLNSATGPQSTQTFTLTQPSATGAGPALCACVEFFTALRGRSYRGKAYVPLAQSHYTAADGSVGGGGIAAYQNLFVNVTNNLLALTPASELVVASRKLSQSFGVTSIQCRYLIGLMRRRQDG